MPAFVPVGVTATVKNVQNFQKKLGVMNGAIVGISSAITTFALDAAVKMTKAVIGIGVASVEAAISFESAFAGVIKTTEGLTDETGNLTEAGKDLQLQFRDLSKEVPAAVEELLQIGEIGGQLGIAKDDLIEFTRTITAMGEATNLSTEDAATQFAQIANIMGTVGEEGNAAFSKMGSAIVALGNNFATTERDISNFASRIAGAGEIAGLTEADVFAIGAAMSSVGIQAEAGGTAVQKVLLAMNEAVIGGEQAFINNNAAIGKTGEKIQALSEKLMLATIRQGEYTDRTKESTKLANQLKIDDLTEQIIEQEQSLQSLIVTNGQVAESGGQLAIFANVAGLHAEEFQKLWEEDAGGAFQLFVEGLGAAGDDALSVLDALELKDQRLIRSFLSLGNAGDLLGRTMETSSVAFENNTALAKEAAQRYATTESQIAIMKNTFKDLGITIGSAVLPIFNELLTAARPFIDQLSAFLAVVGDEFLRGFGAGSEAGGILEGVIWGITEVLDNFIPEESMEQIWDFIDGVKQMWTWLATNLPGAIATTGGFFQDVLVPGFQIAVSWIKENLVPVFSTLQSWFTQILPLAIGIIATKWEEILLPALLALAEVWKTDIQPALELLWEWMKVNIPPIIESLAVLFETVLEPAMKVVGTFISETLIPIIGMLVGKILEALIPILDTLTIVWQQVLLPAIQAIWEFIEENLIPVITALAELIGAVLGLALDVIIGLFTALSEYLKENLAPGMEKFGAWLSETFGPALEGIAAWLEKVTDWFKKLKDKIDVIKLPSWMTPGSPTPLEIGLRGIASAMKELTTSQLPAFKAELDLLGGRPQMGVATPMVAAPQVMPQQNISVQVGPNTISSQMDLAVFENRVLQVVAGAIG